MGCIIPFNLMVLSNSYLRKTLRILRVLRLMPKARPKAIWRCVGINTFLRNDALAKPPSTTSSLLMPNIQGVESRRVKASLGRDKETLKSLGSSHPFTQQGSSTTLPGSILYLLLVRLTSHSPLSQDSNPSSPKFPLDTQKGNLN